MNELIKLNDKIKFVKRIFKTPYHFFYAGTKNDLVGIRFEDKAGRNFTFTAVSMFSAVQAAEDYVRVELKAGNLKEPEPRIKTTETHENQ